MKALKRYGYVDLIVDTLYLAHDINKEKPKSFKNDVNNQHNKERRSAMDDEMCSLKRNNT